MVPSLDTIAAGAAQTYTVAYDFSNTAPTGTYSTAVLSGADVQGTGQTSHNPLQVLGAPVNGGTITIANPTFTPTNTATATATDTATPTFTFTATNTATNTASYTATNTATSTTTNTATNTATYTTTSTATNTGTSTATNSATSTTTNTVTSTATLTPTSTPPVLLVAVVGAPPAGSWSTDSAGVPVFAI